MGSERSYTLPAQRRLRSPVQFAAVTSDPAAWRASRSHLSVVGRLEGACPPGRPPVRFGFTAGKRQARRATDRNSVKRVLREAARTAVPLLDRAVGARALDIVLRLKAPVPARASVPGSTFKRQLRVEADSLLAQLAQRLTDTSRG